MAEQEVARTSNRRYLIGVCDDDQLYRRKLSTAISLMCQKMGVLYEVKLYHSAEAVLEEESLPDILFLDEELADQKERRLNGRDVRADGHEISVSRSSEVKTCRKPEHLVGQQRINGRLYIDDTWFPVDVDVPTKESKASADLYYEDGTYLGTADVYWNAEK